MATTTRRLLLGAASAGAGTLCLPRWTRAAEFTLRYGGNLPASHPLSTGITGAAQEIAEATNGRLEIVVFPNNQLGVDTAMLQQLRGGTLDLMTLSGPILASAVPVAAINGIGFAFSGYDQVWAAMDGAVGAHVRAAIAAAGLTVFERMWDDGYRQITTSTHAIAVPEDLHDVRLRVPTSPLWSSMVAALGAKPVPMNFGQTYAALRDKVADGQENALGVISTAKLYEVQRYCSLTNHVWDGFWLLANGPRWARLPPALQDITRRVMNEAALVQRVQVRALNDGLGGELEDRGMVLNRPDPAPFREALQNAGFYTEWREQLGPEAWVLLENEVGSLG